MNDDAIKLAPKKTRKTALESELVQAVKLAINSRDDARVWRNNVGRLTDARGRMVPYGLAIGSADLVGIVRITPPVDLGIDGRFFALEIKAARGVLSDEQRAWGEVVAKFGGFYRVIQAATGAEAARLAIAALEEAKR